MELLGLAAAGAAMVAVVFGVGVSIEILFNRRFGVSKSSHDDPRLQTHQQTVRNQLGGPGPRN